MEVYPGIACDIENVPDLQVQAVIAAGQKQWIFQYPAPGRAGIEVEIIIEDDCLVFIPVDSQSQVFSGDDAGEVQPVEV